MKLTFKDLKQQKFTIEADPSEKIGQVKEKISAEKGWEPSTQKLIYSGKILQDDNTIESYKIEEKGFIVCMTSKVGLLSDMIVALTLTQDSQKSPHQNQQSHRHLQSPYRPQQHQPLHRPRPLQTLRNRQRPHLLRLRRPPRLQSPPTSMTRLHLHSASSAQLPSRAWRPWASRAIRSTGRCALPSSTQIVLWSTF